MARINLDVALKTVKAQEGIEELKKQFRALAQEFGKVKVDKDFATNIQAITDHYKQLAKAAKEVTKDTEKYKLMEQKLATEQAKTKKLTEQIANIRQQRSIRALREQRTELDRLNKQHEKEEKALRAQEKAAEATEKKFLRLEAQYAAMIIQVEKAQKAGKGEEEQLERINEELRSAWEELQVYNEKQNGTSEEAEEFEKVLLQLKAAFNTVKVEIVDSAEDVDNWKERLKDAEDQIDKVFGNAAVRLWRTWFNEVKKILEDVSETLVKTENAVIELQRVLNDDVDGSRISKSLYNLAYQYGQTFDNASIIAQNFAKSGMSWNQTIRATESALLAMNVAEMDASEASEGLLSIMVQFKKEASELELVVDQLNKTADKNPVTTEKLLKALQRTGSAAVNANLSLEETIGIITALSAATNRSGQNIGTATNALIMYTQKNLDLFAGMSEESAKVVQNFKEGSADVIDIWRQAQEEIKKLRNNQEQFNSLIDIFGGSEGMEELNSSLHDELEDTFEQINSVYSIANTYRKNYFIALLDNLDRLEKVEENLQDARGYSQEENEKYMESYIARQNQVNAKWEELANNEQGFLKFKKGLLDVASWILDLVKSTGGIIPNLIRITGLIGGLVLTVKSAKIVSWVKSVTSAFSSLKYAISATASASQFLQSSFGWIGLLISTVTALITVVDSVKTSMAEAQKAIVEAADATRANGLELKDAFAKLESLDEKTDEYYEAEEKVVSLLGNKANVLKDLTAKTDEYSEAVKKLTRQEIADELQRQRLALKAADLMSITGDSIQDIKWKANSQLFYSFNTERAVERYKDIKSQLQALAKGIADAEYYGSTATVEALQTQYNELYTDEFQKYEADFEKYIEIQETINALQSAYKEIVDDNTKAMFNLGQELEDVTLPTLEEIATAVAAINEKIDEAESNIKVLTDAEKEFEETGELSIDTFQKITALGSEYSDVLEFQNGKLVLNKEKLDELLLSKDAYLEDLINEEVLAYAQVRADELLAVAQAEVGVTSARAAAGVALLNDALSEGTEDAKETVGSYMNLAEELVKIVQQKGLPKQYSLQLWNDVNDYKNKLTAALQSSVWIQSPTDTEETAKTTAKEDTTDYYLEGLKSAISLRKSELTLIEHQGKSTDSQIAKMKEIQGLLHDEAEHQRSLLIDTENTNLSELELQQALIQNEKTLSEINALSSEWWSYQEKILKLYQETLDKAKELELEAIEQVISSIQEQIDLEKEELSIAEKREAVAKAEAEYEKAITEAKKEYVLGVLSDYLTALSDAQTLEEKQKAVAEARAKYETAQKEAQTKAVVEALKAQKDLGNEALSLEEKRLAVEEARQALIDAQNDRTTRVFDEATGEWHYEANAQNVKSAEEKLADAMEALDKYLEGEAWDELIEKMEEGSLTEGEMASILNKWASQGYGTNEWTQKIREAYTMAIGTKADPDSVAGELNAVNNAVDSLNSYLKDRAIKELQQYIKDGNTSAAGMQAIMDKWLSLGEGGEIYQWSNGVLSEVDKAIQSGKYDDSKVQSSINSVVSAINSLKDAIENSFINKLNKLLTSGSSEEMFAVINEALASGEVDANALAPWKKIAQAKAEKEEIEKAYDELKKSMNRDDIIARMKENSAKWYTSSNPELYVQANEALGALIGLVKKNGAWYDKDGKRAYDQGGVLRGSGGIKGASAPEGVLDPALTSKILTPRSEEQFNAFVRAMHIMLDHGNRMPSASPIMNNTSNVDSHNVTNQTLNGVPIPANYSNYTIAQLCEILPILG